MSLHIAGLVPARPAPRTARAILTQLALVFAASALLALVARAQSPHVGHGKDAPSRPARAHGVPLLPNLGTLHRTITTTDVQAQRYFNQGLRLYYAFNHAEALRAFREAQRIDPDCLMCVWGAAMALGPNINAPMDSASEAMAIGAAKRGLLLLNRVGASEHERALVRAVAVRYLDLAAVTRAGRDSAYADAMARLAQRAPDDVDVLSLAAEATMDLSPWAYWTREGVARPGTAQALRWLERGMKLNPSHPGACHFYSHAVEAVQPERAVGCAERLAALMPGAGHLVHMPAHIYIRVGRWADAIAVNQHATHADAQYFDGPHTPNDAFYAAAYRSHNYHFLTLAAVMAGASKTAIDASRQVVKIVTPEVARMAPVVQPMLAVPVQTLLTFGRWDEVLATPLPPEDLRVARAHFWYARGVAFAALGRLAEARATIDSIRDAARSLADGEPLITLQIAARMVEGEMALRTGDASGAVRAFTEAVRLEDGLSYMEPPTWYHPVRQSLGKALLAAGDARAAEQAYRADLKRFPENGWSLRGLSQSLSAQGRTEEARAVDERFTTAWRQADISIRSSRF
jgi:tetratricopeptide (TPR) repeat protein